MTDKLLPLPEPEVAYVDGTDEYGYPAYSHAYTADQMHAYARAHLAAQQAPDGRGTDEQILREREIARHAIVGALAAGYAGATHPGADHWLSAAHDAGVQIKDLEAAQQAEHPDTLRCIKARNDLNAALHGEGALIDDLEHAVANVCAKIKQAQPAPVMDFADVLIALSQHMEVSNWTIKGLECFPDLDGFVRQETDMALLPVEYIKQSGCGDFGYHGSIYFPTAYSNGDGGVMHLRVEYTD